MQNIPRLLQNIDGKKLVYLDAACTYLRNEEFISQIADYYTDFSSCAGDRESSYLGSLLSEKITLVRKNILSFIGADKNDYVIFTSSTTDSINIIAHGIIQNIDTVIVSDLEHNSNYLPWYNITQQSNKKLLLLPYSDIVDGDTLSGILQDIGEPFLLSITHASNILGGLFDIKSIANIVHKFGGYIFVDDAQFIAHNSENAIDNDIDFLAFSGHKIGGPTGIGVLYIKKTMSSIITNSIHLGGGTVKKITNGIPEYKKFPEFLEGGVQNFSGILGLGSIIQDRISQNSNKNPEYIQNLTDFFHKKFNEGIYQNHMSIISFSQGGIVTICPKTFHAIDFHQFCNFFHSKYIISFRTGSFCADNYVNIYLNGEKNIMRFSFGIYNSYEDIDILFLALNEYLGLLKI